MIKMMVRMRG